MASCGNSTEESPITREEIELHSGVFRWSAVEVPVRASEEGLEGTGARIYQERCVICHGKAGRSKGAASDFILTKPRDFSRGEYKLRSTMYFPSDDDLFRTVTVGIPAYGMPSFEYLTAQERWAVVFHVKKLGEREYAAALLAEIVKDEIGFELEDMSPELMAKHAAFLDETRKQTAQYAAENLASEETMTIPPAPAQHQLSSLRGKELYDSLGCATCHGINGDGDGTSAEAMKDTSGRIIRPRNFRDGAWYFKAGNRPEDIVRVILGGVPGTPMPSYDMGEEKNAQLWDVALYVSELSNDTGME